MGHRSRRPCGAIAPRYRAAPPSMLKEEVEEGVADGEEERWLWVVGEAARRAAVMVA